MLKGCELRRCPYYDTESDECAEDNYPCGALIDFLLATLAEKDERIKGLEDISDVQWKRIVELESLKELIDELEKEVGNILVEKDEQIAALTARIKELEGALRDLICADPRGEAALKALGGKE